MVTASGHPKCFPNYLGIPVATLYQWRQRGLGPPAIKLGKHLRYLPEAVKQWLQSQEGLDGISKP